MWPFNVVVYPRIVKFSCGNFGLEFEKAGFLDVNGGKWYSPIYIDKYCKVTLEQSEMLLSKWSLQYEPYQP